MARQRRRQRSRRFNVFSLSFLDVMAGGFGAVVIIFLIIKHSVAYEIAPQERNLRSEARLIDFELRKGEDNLAILREQVDVLQKRIADAKKELNDVTDTVQKRNEDIDEIESEADERTESLKDLHSEVESVQREVKELQEAELDATREQRIAIAGQGDRQYLTGLYLGGNNILIAVDISASMLDDDLVNILRRRNMSEERQIRAPKWQRAIRTVEWLVANIPRDRSYQIVTFNTDVEFLVGDGGWEGTGDTDLLIKAMEQLQETVPKGGTNLAKVFVEASKMQPLPDNMLLIVDGLPTQGIRPPNRPIVNSNQRVRLFNEAIGRLPAGIPINVILFPLEGDPLAPGYYWYVSYNTGGTFLAPSDDWP